MTQGYRVRPALHDDLASIMEVLAQNQAVQPATSRQPSELTERHVAMWERIQESPDVTVYVAESSAGAAAGTACLSVLPNLTYDCRPPAFVEAVVVAYDHRRRGVAHALMEQLLADARAAGCYKVQLLSHKRHADDGAHDLYAGLGFVPEAAGFRHYLT